MQQKSKSAYWKKLKLDMAVNGTVAKTYMNIWKILNNDPEIEGKIRLNTVDERIHAYLDLPWNTSMKVADDDGTDFFTKYDKAQLYTYIADHIGYCSKEFLDNAIKDIAAKKYYDPRKEYFDNLKWDNVPRLERLFVDYLGAEDDDYTRYLTKLVFVGGVARTYKPGIKFDIVPVLVGEQGIGKSLLTSKMAVRNDWYSNDIAVIDKSAHEKVIGKLIVDLSELSAMSKNPERLKDFVSSTVDVLRCAYEADVGTYARKCIFIASTDKEKFLNDMAGERRWFPVKCSADRKKKDVSTLARDEIDELWAEAKIYYETGMSLEFPASLIPAAEKLRRSYSEIEEEADRIREYIKSHNCDRICAYEILEKCFFANISQKGIGDRVKHINSILKNKLGLEPSTLNFGKYGRMRGFKVNQS